MSGAKTRPRCGRPLREQAGNGAFPVCGRAEGHPGYPGTCLSEAAYEAQLALQNAVRRGEEAPRRAKQAATVAREENDVDR